jgi:hypothetical protein
MLRALASTPGQRGLVHIHESGRIKAGLMRRKVRTRSDASECGRVTQGLFFGKRVKSLLVQVHVCYAALPMLEKSLAVCREVSLK